MALAAYICATRRDPGVELHWNTRTAKGRQQPIPRIRNLSALRIPSPIAVTDVTARQTNRDVSEGPSPYPDAKHVFRRYGSLDRTTVDGQTNRPCDNPERARRGTRPPWSCRPSGE